MILKTNQEEKMKAISSLCDVDLNKISIYKTKQKNSLFIDVFEIEDFWDYAFFYVLTEDERMIAIRDGVIQTLNETIFFFDELEFIFDLKKDEILELLIPEMLTGEFIKYYDENGQEVVHYYSLVHLIERTMRVYRFAERRAEYLIQFDHKKAVNMIGDKEFFKNGIYIYGIDW